MSEIIAHFGMLEHPQQVNLSRMAGAQIPADCTDGNN
jgi:hypothetical protein